MCAASAPLGKTTCSPGWAVIRWRPTRDLVCKHGSCFKTKLLHMCALHYISPRTQWSEGAYTEGGPIFWNSHRGHLWWGPDLASDINNYGPCSFRKYCSSPKWQVSGTWGSYVLRQVHPSLHYVLQYYCWPIINGKTKIYSRPWSEWTELSIHLFDFVIAVHLKVIAWHDKDDCIQMLIRLTFKHFLHFHGVVFKVCLLFEE